MQQLERTRGVEPSQPPSLLQMVSQRAHNEGRTDSSYPGLRFLRYSRPVAVQKAQVLLPGLVIVLQGKKTARVGSRVLTYDPQTYLVLATETTCEAVIVEADSRAPYLAVSLDLPLDLLARTLSQLAAVEPRAAPAPADDGFVSPVEPALLSAFTRLLAAVDDPIERELLGPLIVEEIVLRLLRSEGAAAIRASVGHAGDAPQIQKAMAFMRDHHASALSVEQIARHVAMSPSHLAHRFRAVARVSPMRYLRQVRLEAARSHMLSRGMRASEAATSVGYESVSHFSREFKESFGLPPARYVRQWRASVGAEAEE